MEHLERARMREAQRLDPSALEPIVIKSLDHLKRVISELAPSSDDNSNVVQVPARMNVKSNDGRESIFDVTAPTKSKTKRQMIIDSLNILKHRKEVAEKARLEDRRYIVVNNREVRPLEPFVDDPRLSIDSLISHWTGGERRGEHIYWNIGGIEYKYDIFNHRLTKINA